MKSQPIAPATVLVAISLAGCMAATEPAEFKSALGTAYVFDGSYHWPPLEQTDSDGNVTNRIQGARDDPKVPRTIQQLIPLGGAQPSLGITASGEDSSSLFVLAWDRVQRSDDWGRTWTRVHNFTSPGYPSLQDRWMAAGADLWVDAPSNHLHAVQMYGEQWGHSPDHPPESMCSGVARSRDGGATWEEIDLAHCSSVSAPIGPSARFFTPPMMHPRIVAGPPSKEAGVQVPDAARNGFAENVYLCYASEPRYGGEGERCATSFDGGKTFSQLSILHPSIGCIVARAGRPAVTPDGTVVVPVGWEYSRYMDQGYCNSPPTVYVSRDNGATWTERRSPNASVTNAEMDPAVLFTPDGTGFLAFRSSADQQVYVYRSRDHFETWQGPFRVSPRSLTLTAYTAMAVGDDGRVAIAYLGTRYPQDPGSWSGTAHGNTRWHLFVTTSFDLEADRPTFTTEQVTPQEDPVQGGCIVPPGGAAGPLVGSAANGACGNLQNLLTMAADVDGRYVVGFTDGCSPRVGCTGDTVSSYYLKDRQAAVAVLDHGPGLRGDKVLPSLALQPPAPLASWAVVGGLVD